MKRNNKTLAKIKRGFTLVELVIVIAVIAILAAVLIPTFITVIDSANNSADVQLVANMNAVLATDFDADSTATAENLRKLMKDNGIDNFETKKSDNVILYDKSAKKFVLMSDFEKKVKAASLSAAGKTGAAKNLAAKPLAEEGGLTLDENAYSFEDIFKGYIVVSTGGNPLAKALHDLHNLPSNLLTNENTNTIITNAFASIDNVAIKDVLKGIINTTCIITKTGYALNGFIGTENITPTYDENYPKNKDPYKAVDRVDTQSINAGPGPVRTKVIFHEDLETFDLTKFPKYAVGALSVVLPQTMQSITMTDTTKNLNNIMLMGNTSIITAEQKQTLIGKGAQFTESPLPLAELKEQLTEKGSLIAQSEFYVANEENAEEWKYTDLKTAIEAAKESASLSGLNRTVVVTQNYEIAQSDTIEIPAGVTLLLPYDVEPADGKYQENATVKDNKSSFETEGKKSVELTVDGTIINRGTIAVGGETTGQQGGQSGCTAGRYAQITLGANAKIESYGDINSYGFIVEAASVDENHPQVIMHSGAMKMPFIVVEHRGGSQFLFMADDGWEAAKEAGKPETKDANGNPKNLNASETVKYFLTSPFNRFYMENVRVPLTVEYGAQLLGYADLAAGDGEGGAVTDHTTDIKLVGSSSDALIELKQNTKLIAKYDTASKVTNVEIKGSAKMNSLTMSVVVATVTTEEVFFPLSWYWNVKLSPFEDGTAATVDTTAQKIKLLPGAKLTVSKGVTLKASEIVVYDENAISDITDPANGGKTPYEKKEQAATLTVNGTLEANALGGKVLTNESGAKLTVKTVEITTQELKKNAVKQVTKEQDKEGGGKETVVVTPYQASEYKKITTKLTGKTAAGDNQELAAGTYVAKDGKWESANA